MIGLLLTFSFLGVGLLVLYVAIFTLTLQYRFLLYFRLALAPPAIVVFWNFGYGPYIGPTRTSTPAMATISLYGIMRILEHCVVSLWDTHPPHWVTARTQSVDGSRTVVPLPITFRNRCIYSMDLLTSMRGSSWFGDLEWNWVPRSLSSQPPITRTEFILSNMRTFVLEYLIFDLCDVILRLRSWDSKLHNAITGLPMFQQVLFSICICIEILLSMKLPYTLISSAFVLCGSSPTSWPPLFDSPFSSLSLGDFWSHRWHLMFRRVFERLFVPLFWVLNIEGGANVRLVGITRTIMIFLLSTLLHLIIMHRACSVEIGRAGRTGASTFFDPSIIGFFLLQPLGLVVESTMVVPLANWLFPISQGDRVAKPQNLPTTPRTSCNGDVKVLVTSTHSIRHAIDFDPFMRWKRDSCTRIYAWLFLIWTGRWWSDAWIRAGALDKDVKLMPISILRGLWDGRWLL